MDHRHEKCLSPTTPLLQQEREEREDEEEQLSEREEDIQYKGKSHLTCPIKNKCCWLAIFLLWCVLMSGIIAAGITLSILKPNNNNNNEIPSPSPSPSPSHYDNTCGQYCRLSLVESIPENLTYPVGSPSHISTYDVWVWLLDHATSSIDIASYYWTLRGDDDNSDDPTDVEGKDIYNRLIQTHQRGVKIRVVQSQSTPTFPNKDTADLSAQGVIELRNMDMKRLIGAGILHTKLWIVDGLHFYVGSANMDWRALTQVKELGLFGQNCSCLVYDVQKIFEVYWNTSSDDGHIPPCWPEELTADTNSTNPALLQINGTLNNVYWTSSPPKLSTKYRTDDITGLLDVIAKAQRFIYIAVMDYYPAMLYDEPKIYWPVIDDALRSAAYDRGIEVRLMGSCWNSTSLDMVTFLKSLNTWSNSVGPNKGSINTKLFIVPQLNRTIQYARVNHNKYMVTDNAGFISTSNWSGDYFNSTGGISCVVKGTNYCPSPPLPSSSSNPPSTPPPHSSSSCGDTIRDQLVDIFERDWNSQYAGDVAMIDQVSQCLVG